MGVRAQVLSAFVFMTVMFLGATTGLLWLVAQRGDAFLAMPILLMDFVLIILTIFASCVVGVFIIGIILELAKKI